MRKSLMLNSVLALALWVLSIQPAHSQTATTATSSTPAQSCACLVLADLRAKQQPGTLTAEVKARLEQWRQTGGCYLNGIPGGRRGAGMGMGPRNGTGPRAQWGACPLVATSGQVTGAEASASGRGAARGWRNGNGNGRGGFRAGLRNGTGPRSQLGTCPLTNSVPVR